MKSNKFIFIALFSIIFTSSTSCKNEEALAPNELSDGILNLPLTPYDYANPNLPSHFSTEIRIGPNTTSVLDKDNTPSDNLITNDGATLGRVLFYDKNLSANGTIACASCHKQNKGFSEDKILSEGFEGGLTGRHSMSLINARYYQRGRFFWDERAATLEEQVLKPFQDSVEMGLTLEQLVSKVGEQGFYPQLFENAFGSQEVTTDKISKAIAQFVRSIISSSSKYDMGRASVASPIDDFPNFTQEENIGKGIFFKPIAQGGGSCFGCHTTEAFINNSLGPENNGLDAASTTDLGAGGAYNNPAFVGRFKTSSLRNIELTSPYMHDGRFATLEKVVEHYNSGIQNHPTLSPILKDANGNPTRLNLKSEQAAALVAFLKTLTDNSVNTEVKWSDPFK